MRRKWRVIYRDRLAIKGVSESRNERPQRNVTVGGVTHSHIGVGGQDVALMVDVCSERAEGEVSLQDTQTQQHVCVFDSTDYVLGTERTKVDA